MSLTVQSFRTDTIFILNIPKENNYEKKKMVELWFFSAYCPMKLYICSKFHENIDDHFKVIEYNFKGALFCKKTQQELRFLFSTRRLMLLYICTMFHENILEGIKVIEQTRFSLEKFQRGIISQKLK